VVEPPVEHVHAIYWKLVATQCASHRGERSAHTLSPSVTHSFEFAKAEPYFSRYFVSGAFTPIVSAPTLPMNTPAPIPPCRLCGALTPLEDSHIISDMFVRAYGSKIVTGNHGQEQAASILVSTVPGIASGRKQHGSYEWALGIKEELLCGKCERQFGEYERIFRGNFYTGPRDKPRKKPITSPTRTVAYPPFKLFLLSLLWRASVASGTFFRNVALDSEHESKIASALLAESPGPESFYEFAIFDLRLDDHTMEDFTEEPRYYAERNECRIIVGGFLFAVHISDGSLPTPPSIRAFSLRCTGEFALRIVHEELRNGGFLRHAHATGAIPQIAVS